MIKIESVSYDEYKKTVNKFEFVPLWASSIAAEGYTQKEFLIIKENDNIKGFFLLPLCFDGNRLTAEREYRVYPYASPIIFEKDNMKRRQLVYELFKYIKNKYPLIELPLHYNFKDIAAVQSLGMFVDMWHTHITRKKLTLNDIPSGLRYSVSYANRYVNIVYDKDYEQFNFEKAIHGKEEEIALRKKNVINLIDNNKAIIFSAYDKITNKKVASTVISFDNSCAYYLHCYREKDSVRGVVPLMIIKAIEYAFDVLKVDVFDFEGAVIQSIDKFLSTFNVEIVPYGYLYFAKDDDEFHELIQSTLNIEGRIEYE